MGRMNSITDYNNTARDTSTIFFGGGVFAKLTGEDGALRKCPVDIFSEWASMRRESQGAATGLAVSALNHVAHRLSEPKNGELYIFDDTDRVNGQGYTGIGGKLADAGEKAYRFVSKDGRVDTDGSRSSGGNQNIQINITLLINPWLVVKEFPQMEIISLKN